MSEKVREMLDGLRRFIACDHMWVAPETLIDGVFRESDTLVCAFCGARRHTICPTPTAEPEHE